MAAPLYPIEDFMDDILYVKDNFMDDMEDILYRESVGER
jgi:hypothetical protein